MTNVSHLRDHSVLDPDAVPAALAVHLAAAAAPPSAGELAGERAAVAAFAAATTRRAPADAGRRRVRTRRGVLVAAAALGLVGVSGAAAAAGSLPKPAQDVARTALTKVGVDVPAGKGTGLDTAPGQLKADGTAATPNKAKPATPATPAKAKPSKPAKPAAPTGGEGVGEDKADRTHPENKGAVISDLAHQEYPSGAAKGAAISEAASDGRSHAGEARPVGPEAAGAPASSPGATAPGRATAAAAPKGP